jgi:opacity protein-like surface antigen
MGGPAGPALGIQTSTFNPTLMRALVQLSTVALAAALTAPALSAQMVQDPFSSRPLRLGIAGGVIVPRTGASIQKLQAGMQGQGFLLIQLPGLPALRANVDYARMKFDEARLSTGGPTLADGDRTILDGVIALKMDLIRTGPIRPYLLAGVGAFNVKDVVEGVSGGTQSFSDTNYGFDGGAGIGFRLGPISGFVESRLQNVYTKEKGFVDTKSIQQFPVTFGLVF